MMLELNTVQSGYGKVTVIREVSLTVAPGEVVAILGANGAGKTTLARTISGTLPLRAGRIVLDGDDISRMTPHARARRGIIQVPEGRRLFGSLTVSQNIDLGRIAGRKRSGDQDGLERLIESFPKLKILWKRQAGLLSGGEQQMVALARAAAGRPRVLILDEPSLGLSPLLVDEVFAMVDLMSRELGCAVLLIEQLADRALSAASRGVVIAHGEVATTGSAEELRQSSWQASTAGEELSLIEPEAVPRPRTAKGRATLIQLKAAGREVFRRDGYVRTRVSDISDEAGLSNGAFYRYFEDKEHLMLVVLDDFLSQYRDYIRVPFDSDRPLASVQASYERYLEFYRDHVDLMLLLLQAGQVVPEVEKLRIASTGEVYSRMARLLSRCHELGILNEGVRPEILAPLVGGMVEQYAFLAYVHDALEVTDPAQIAAEITAVWSRGVLNKAAH
jgi:branched-chain amino acid transport system ATP-binding protein